VQAGLTLLQKLPLLTKSITNSSNQAPWARPKAIPPGPKNEKMGSTKGPPIFGPTWGQLPIFEFLVQFWIW
jgi:hypothetical protein